MEDSKICCTDLGDGNALFAVFDGHNGTSFYKLGREISTFLSRNLGNSLKKSEKYQAKKYKEALRNVFV